MAGAAPKKRSGEATRQRILAAAAAQFARTSYEEVKLREIAREVGVDVAYVHRCFGSKEQLFADVLEATHADGPNLIGEPDDLPRIFTDETFNRDAIGFNIFICSLSSAKAREILKAFGLRQFIEPLTEKMSGPASLRATLLVACMTGMKVTREVFGLDPFADLTTQECRSLVEGIFRACLEADPAASRKDSETRTRKVRQAVAATGPERRKSPASARPRAARR